MKKNKARIVCEVNKMVSGGYSLRRKEFKRYTVFVIWFQVGTAWSGVTVNLLIQKCSTPSKSH
jgi:hypothetical protein